MKVVRITAVTALVVAGLFTMSVREVQAWPPFPTFPSFPVVVTPPTPVGINPWTGGVDTAGMTVHNSVVDPWRGASMGNGSMRPVSRPVFNGAGAVVGWETGTEWTNSVTGQVHGETQTATSNGFGGLHTQYTSKSAGRRNSPPSRFARPR